MPITIDSIEKLEAAHRILKSGGGTPEQRAELEAEMSRLAPAIRLGTRDVTDYGIKYSELTPTDQQLVLELQRKRNERERGKDAAILSVAPRGLATSALKIGKAITDLVGWDTASDALGKSKEEIEQNGVQLAIERRKRWAGRELSDAETAQVAKDAQLVMRGTGLAGELGAGIATGGATLGARGLLSGIGLGAAEGAAWGYVLADAEGDTAAQRRADRLGEAALGATIGGAAGSLTGVAATVRNMIRSSVRKYSEDATEAFKIADTFGVSIDLGQASGSPVIIAAQEMAGANYAQSYYRNQANTLAQNIGKKLEMNLPKLADVGSELPEKAADAFKAFDDVIGSMRQYGQQVWRESAERATRLSSPDELVMPELSGLRTQIDDIIQQMDLKTSGAMKPGVNLRRVSDMVDALSRRGGATVDDVDALWQKINTMASDPVGAGFVNKMGDKEAFVDTMAGTLRRAMMRQIEAAPPSPAMTALRAGRQSWSNNQKAIQEVQERVLDKLGIGANASAAQVRKALDEVSVSRMREVMSRLRKTPGGHAKIRQIKESLFESTVDDAMEASLRKSQRTGDVDIETFVREFGATTQRSRMAGILTADEEKLAQEGIELARRIMNADAIRGGVKHRIVTGAENIAINVISRDPGFMARLLAGAAARGRGADWLFHTKEGVEMLRAASFGPKTAVKSPAITRRRNALIVLLSGMLNDGSANSLEDELGAQMEQPQ